MQNSGVDVLCCGSCPKKAALKWNPQKVLASCEAFLDTFPFAGAERDMDNPRHTTRKWWTYVEIVLVSAQPMKEWKDLSTQPEFVQWYCWSFACGIIILQCCEKTPSVSQDLEHRSVIVMRCDEMWWVHGLHGLHGQGLGLVEALRIVLATFRLPGEVAVGPTHGPTHGPSPIQQAIRSIGCYSRLWRSVSLCHPQIL